MIDFLDLKSNFFFRNVCTIQQKNKLHTARTRLLKKNRNVEQKKNFKEFLISILFNASFLIGSLRTIYLCI